jgi:dTDP-4-amino-4,6-dideoxygalactose transaminase
VHWVARFERAADLDRDRVGEQLARLGVQTKPYYAPVLHRSDLGDGTPPEDLPVTELLADEVLALPLSSEMTVEEAERVVMALDRILLPTCDRSWA